MSTTHPSTTSTSTTAPQTPLASNSNKSLPNPAIPAKQNTQTTPQTPSSDSPSLQPLHLEALWYAQFQQQFTTSLQEAIAETETLIIRAHRSLDIVEREHRDRRRAMVGKEGYEGKGMEGYESEVKKMREEVREIEGMIAQLEERGRVEREVLGKVSEAGGIECAWCGLE